MDIVIQAELDENNEETTNSEDYFNYRTWEWKYLREECEKLQLEDFYQKYVQRLQRSYLSIFFVTQIIIGLIHTIFILSSQNENSSRNPDTYIYMLSILLLWITLFAVFKDGFVKKYPNVPAITSCLAVIILVISDLMIPLYHMVANPQNKLLRPAYGSHILFVIYIFLPLSINRHAVILGLSTSLCYIIQMALVTYRDDSDFITKVGIELLFLLCVNFLGFYFRLMNEVTIRKAFLDRRECVEGNLILRFERDQEKELLLSILPEHTATELETDIKNMIKKIKSVKLNSTTISLNPKDLFETNNSRIFRGQQIKEELYVEEHHDVTILYADIVNYTFMTTQLEVKTLVETLHDLFVRFDQASEQFNVLRIKFLGDCYYCVSGVPVKNPLHAKCCVDLGLQMIKDIREIRQKHLNLDMRIGIHSGSIVAGVIGACKWQYDIWSKDVNIANKMEATGEAGKVHVTGQTLKQLDGNYLYTEGTNKAKNDPTLAKYNIKTYLISGEHVGDSFPTTSTSRKTSIGVKRLLSKTNKQKSRSSYNVEPYPTSSFMINSMEQYRQIMTQTNDELEIELDRMPIGKIHFNKLFSTTKPERRSTEDDSSYNISTFLMCFTNRLWESSYQNQSDLMLKYSILVSFVVLLLITAIQILNHIYDEIFWIVSGTSITILILFILIAWFRTIWIKYIPALQQSNDDINLEPQPVILKKLHDFFYTIMNNIIPRTIIYLIIVFLLILVSLINLTEPLDIHNYDAIINPWAYTQCLILAICINFFFLKIHFLLKFFIGFVIIIFYGYIIFFRKTICFEGSTSTNIGLNPEVSHFLTILFTTIIFHLIDRQIEYISRVDFNWKQVLLQKKEEAEFTKDTNKILVQNILPVHVAEIYMSRQLKSELYHEEYENVAIMFATIPNYDINMDTTENVKSLLHILNRIVCDFDKKLLSHNGPLKIEKIKVAAWTYMVACGLDPGRGDSSGSVSYIRLPTQRSSLMPNGRRSLNTTRSSLPNYTVLATVQNNINNNNNVSEPNKHNLSNNPVLVLTEFALNLMRILKTFNEENFQNYNNNEELLRVGISHGKVMAGVVGSSKPLYDVWGHPVNMASRMDSTGIRGKIQVTHETSEVLKSFGIKCQYRGETMVKGTGKIPTYFVNINDDLEFEKTVNST